VLIEAELRDVTNLNRIAGATPDDVGKPRVYIAKRHVLLPRAMHPSAQFKMM
jgi:tRNA A37 threonylcarbamoyladenosine dehydratase